MKMSDSDKKLLYVAGGLIILVLAFYFGVLQISNKTSELNEANDELRERYEVLVEKDSNRQFYLEEIDRYRQSYTDVLANFPAQLIQEEELLYIIDGEDICDIAISQLGFVENSVIYDFTDIDGNSTGQSGISSSITLSYSGTYDAFKNFITYIEETELRTVNTDFTAAYDNETELVQGNITLTKYAVLADDREVTDSNITDIETGKTDIFTR